MNKSHLPRHEIVCLFLAAGCAILLSAACQTGGAGSGENGPSEAARCAELMSFTAPGLVVASAEALLKPEPEPNPFSGEPMPALAPHCKVAGVIESEIHFELRLPFSDAWNGRFAMGGGGGFVGSVINSLLFPATSTVPVLEAGYATVGTDTGHQGSNIDGSWALENDNAERNFADRAVHLVAELSKQITEHHYGSAIDYSYFVGCSRGGGQAMIASQRYPDDFDGIVAAAPAFSWPSLAASMVQNQQAMYPDPTELASPVVTPDNRALLEREILKACDALDEVEDGVLTDPRTCTFDPASLPRCEAGPAPGCLTEAQLHAIQTIYRGPVVAGRSVFPGFPFGGENDRGGWDVWITGGKEFTREGSPNLQFAFGTQFHKYFVFDDPDFDYSTYDFAGWHEDAAPSHALLSATDTNLSRFRDRGGKIVFWHGWSDPALSALATIDYFDAMRRDTERTDEFARLFMLPGVLHCGGGPGADGVDWLALIADWVENGKAPDRVVASRVASDGTTELTRALCPYPMVADYDGDGDPKQETSYACVEPPDRSTGAPSGE